MTAEARAKSLVEGGWIREFVETIVAQEIREAENVAFEKAAAVYCWRCAENPDHIDTENCTAFSIRALRRPPAGQGKGK